MEATSKYFLNSLRKPMLSLDTFVGFHNIVEDLRGKDQLVCD
jgi:hypothetical protein